VSDDSRNQEPWTDTIQEVWPKYQSSSPPEDPWQARHPSTPTTLETHACMQLAPTSVREYALRYDNALISEKLRGELAIPGLPALSPTPVDYASSMNDVQGDVTSQNEQYYHCESISTNSPMSAFNVSTSYQTNSFDERPLCIGIPSTGTTIPKFPSKRCAHSRITSRGIEDGKDLHTFPVLQPKRQRWAAPTAAATVAGNANIQSAYPEEPAQKMIDHIYNYGQRTDFSQAHEDNIHGRLNNVETRVPMWNQQTTAPRQSPANVQLEHGASSDMRTCPTRFPTHAISNSPALFSLHTIPQAFVPRTESMILFNSVEDPISRKSGTPGDKTFIHYNIQTIPTIPVSENHHSTQSLKSLPENATASTIWQRLGLDNATHNWLLVRVSSSA
jgi:hypothetical protein